MRTRRRMRQVDVAHAIGVAQTTIANYEQGTRFPDERTLLALADFFDVALDSLLGRNGIAPGVRNGVAIPDVRESDGTGRSLDPGKLFGQYFESLLRCDRRGASDLLVNAVEEGMPVREVFLRVLQPALWKIGELWHDGEIDVCTEHLISEWTEEMMIRLSDRVAPRAKPYTFIGLAVNGELHDTGIRMVTHVFGMEGWNALFLGGNLPHRSVIRAIETHKAHVLGVSVTMGHNINVASDLIRVIRSQTPAVPVKILVGGRAFNTNPQVAEEIGADNGAVDAGEALAVAERTLAAG